MQEMVKIFQYKIGDEEINSVNARELHKILKSKQQFANWIQNRLKDTMADENIDYIIMEMPTNGVFDKVVKNSTEREEVFNNSIKNPLGGRPAKEYIITLDLAKEFSMLEKNAKGKEIRQYFIQFLEDLVASSDRLISMYKKQLEAKTIDEDIRRLVRRKEQLKQEGYL